MRIFDFTLMNGYEFSGVDVAQGFRAKLFKKNNIDIKYCFNISYRTYGYEIKLKKRYIALERNN